MSLDRLIEDYYSKQEPSGAFWASIDARRRKNGLLWVRGFGALATLCALALSGWWMHVSAFRVSIFEEVATHHLEQKSMDVLSSDYAMLAVALSDFGEGVESLQPFMSEYDLVGGRYCSIRHRLALQLRLRHRISGQFDTLYVTRLNYEMKKTASYAERDVGDVSLKMWKEKERLYVLASSQ